MRNAAKSLEELVAPLPEAEFLSLLRQRRLTLLRGTNAERHTALLGWETLKRMIERGEYPRGLGDFRVARESVSVPADRWLTKNKADNTNKVDTGKIEEFLAKGFSLIIMPIERHAPALAALCESIKSRLSEQIKIGVIVTTGAGGAFKLHYDPEDLIILQVEGTKRWRIFGPAVSNPVVGMPKQMPPAENAPILDEVLQPGDLLFVPGGNWHHCENGPGRSLHLGIFFIPPTGWHAVNALTSQLLSEEIFRTPLTRLESDSEFAALEAEVKSRLAQKIGQLKLGDFRAQWNKKASS
jgi:ribosomal protein L16 Arg81 hydroxylase